MRDQSPGPGHGTRKAARRRTRDRLGIAAIARNRRHRRDSGTNRIGYTPGFWSICRRTQSLTPYAKSRAFAISYAAWGCRANEKLPEVLCRGKDYFPVRDFSFLNTASAVALSWRGNNQLASEVCRVVLLAPTWRSLKMAPSSVETLMKNSTSPSRAASLFPSLIDWIARNGTVSRL